MRDNELLQAAMTTSVSNQHAANASDVVNMHAHIVTG